MTPANMLLNVRPVSFLGGLSRLDQNSNLVILGEFTSLSSGSIVTFLSQTELASIGTVGA